MADSNSLYDAYLISILPFCIFSKYYVNTTHSTFHDWKAALSFAWLKLQYRELLEVILIKGKSIYSLCPIQICSASIDKHVART